MHRSTGFAHLELPLPALPSRPAPVLGKDEDFCLPITASAQALPAHSPAPVPKRSGEEPVILDSLDDGDGGDFPFSRESLHRRRRIPSFVPFQPESFATLKNPWSVHSVIDLFRLFLPELSASIAIMAGCGLMAGKLLARWTDGIPPLWVAGLYVAILTLYLGVVYLGGKGNNSSGLKTSLRTLVVGLLFLLIPHMIAFLILTIGA
jgi:hypothetical protein